MHAPATVPDLETAFQQSKEAIVTEITAGVEIFDTRRRTCLTPDWSTTGVGYWLHQQHCECDALALGCCPDGWWVTLAGSRFLRDAERRYVPVEGEALAVAWALEDGRFFTMGEYYSFVWNTGFGQDLKLVENIGTALVNQTYCRTGIPDLRGTIEISESLLRS